MSIYSGFPTRQLQTLYNQLLLGLIEILQQRVLKFYKGDYCQEEAFRTALSKLTKRMSSLQQNKHLDPKFSSPVQPLCSYLQDLPIKQPILRGSFSTEKAELNVDLPSLKTIPEFNMVYVSTPFTAKSGVRGVSAPRARFISGNKEMKDTAEGRDYVISKIVNQVRKKKGKGHGKKLRYQDKSWIG